MTLAPRPRRSSAGWPSRRSHPGVRGTAPSGDPPAPALTARGPIRGPIERNSGQLRATHAAVERRTAPSTPGTLRLGAGRSQVQILSPRSRSPCKAQKALCRGIVTGVQMGCNFAPHFHPAASRFASPSRLGNLRPRGSGPGATHRRSPSSRGGAFGLRARRRRLPSSSSPLVPRLKSLQKWPAATLSADVAYRGRSPSGPPGEPLDVGSAPSKRSRLSARSAR